MKKVNRILSNGFEDEMKQSTKPMTMQGTIYKILALLSLTIFSFCLTWSQYTGTNESHIVKYLIIGVIVGLVSGLTTSVNPKIAKFTSPIYALAQGCVLGGLSAVLNSKSEGLAIQAVLTTFSLLSAMLIVYKFKIIKVTDKFKRGIYIATFGIFIIYLLNLILNLFGLNVPLLHSTGIIGILISLFIVGVATLNLLVDFDFIENAVNQRYPKHLEWYGAFGVIVTLIWLYLEVIDLLQKLRK